LELASEYKRKPRCGGCLDQPLIDIVRLRTINDLDLFELDQVSWLDRLAIPDFLSVLNFPTTKHLRILQLVLFV